MKHPLLISSIGFACLTLLLAPSSLSAATHYVSLESTNPTPPYTNWATAATQIQSAVDYAGTGDTVLVADGVYALGERQGFDASLETNRVVLTRAITLQSVNGPQFTMIDGRGTVRCACLTNGASLSGLTLTNGSSSWRGGGVLCISTNALVTNCVIVGNSAEYGGGACGGTLYNCAVTGNSAESGGGAFFSTLYGCWLTGNEVGYYGGGAEDSTLYNCTLTGNGAGYDGGGASESTLYNCIVYFNTSPGEDNYFSSTLNYCCSMPLPTDGVGNIALDPRLASASHLSAGSPCIGAGSATYAAATDIDGELWGNPPSIGCDECRIGARTGPLIVKLVANYTNVTVGYPVDLCAMIEGRATDSVWNFGDSGTATNAPYIAHSWTAPGDYSVALWAFNESHPEGTSATLTIHVVAPPVVYVDSSSGNPQPPYNSWATAATNIQDAVTCAEAMAKGTGLVLVTNGVYSGGVNVTNPLTLASVNGPEFTVIEGGGTTQCASLTDWASLTGFTLTNGCAAYGAGVSGSSTNAFLTNCVIGGNWAGGSWELGGGEGGGAILCTLYNCTLIGNSARGWGWPFPEPSYAPGVGGAARHCALYNCTLTGNTADDGGGAASCTLYNCTLTGNSAGSGGGADGCVLYNSALTANSAGYGGGANSCTLYNCTLTGNSAQWGPGGGASGGALYNCIVYFNTAPSGANYDPGTTLNYCDSTPLATNGVGNIDADPQLVTAACLSADSPCRGAGSASYATGTDIDGELWGNPPSIGCDEYHPGTVTGPLTVRVTANYTNVAVGYPLALTGWIGGRATDSVWEFGDGDVVLNEPYTTHSWSEPGDYRVALWAFNQSNLEGVCARITIHVIAQPIAYVSATSTNPQPPYLSWATAATNIQDAVDAPLLGLSAVVVDNGTYPGGVNVSKPVELLSAHGPQFTLIDGGGTSQCVWLTDGAGLSGFTVNNGQGGVGCNSTNAFVTNCILTGNSGGASGGSLYNCTLTGNSVGAAGCTLYGCNLTSNYAGGASGSVLYDCVLRANRAHRGGGASESTLYNCTLTGNSAPGGHGGGAYACTLYNCALSGNQAPREQTWGGLGGSGGGADSSTLYNCALSGNSVECGSGGGANGCKLYNCTLTGNSASGGFHSGRPASGGGASASTLYNCIVYFNTAASGAANYDTNCTLNYCCAAPLPIAGQGNTCLDPQLADASHVSAGSPCRGAGSATCATGTDIDGEPWANPPSIGCDEYHAGAITGPLSVRMVADYTNVAVGYAVKLTAFIEGRATENVWDFGDGIVISNRPYASHAWAAPGDYVVVLRAYNETLPGGVSAAVTIHVQEGMYYVAAGSINPQRPYTSWSTAARRIQDAVNAAVPGGLLLVSNGVYFGGVALSNQMSLRSVNGPQFTVINGVGTNTCVTLNDGASLTGFTLTNGQGGVRCGFLVAEYQGGFWCHSTNAFVTNCVLTGSFGKGASGGTLYNCTLSQNSGCGASGSTLYNSALAGNSSGGATSCTLYNCTVTGNSDFGAYASALFNCVVCFNTRYFDGTALGVSNYDRQSTLSYCCTTPLPTNGVGNIAVDPQLASATHLSADSPCIGAGSADYASGTDIDGEPWGSPPSIGCDEYHPGAVTGPLAVSFQADYTNVMVGYPVSLKALIAGQTTDSVWDFGDGDIALNEPYVSHSWTQPGDYHVGLWAFNESNPAGVSAMKLVRVLAERPVHYVAASSANPQPPYTTWATAARNIQPAVDAAIVPGALVLVTNGMYSGEISLARGLTLQSVNGPRFTTIDGGGGENQCVLLSGGASLTGFTLTNDYVGVECEGQEVVSNCFITGTSMYGFTCGPTIYVANGACLLGSLYYCTLTGNDGGGACAATLYNCVLSDNGSWAADGCTLYNCTLRNNALGAGSCILSNCTLTGHVNDYYGGAARECTLYNCTLTGNYADYGGGAAWSALYNCTLSGNHAYYGGGGAYDSVLYNCVLRGNQASTGGGAAWGTLYNCILTGNSACQSSGTYSPWGGGATECALYNCTLTGNSAYQGAGGTYSSTLYNCILYYNTAPAGANYWDSTLNYCCTAPLPTGVGNISQNPLFISYSSNLRLQSNSPCINAGNNLSLTSFVSQNGLEHSMWFTNLFDVDANSRVVGGTVDIGAYEYQGTGSRISYAWLQQFGLPTDGSADFAHADADGLNNWQEWRCGTCPTNCLSALRLLSASPTGTNVTVRWQSVPGIDYFLEQSADLAPPFTLVATNIPGEAGTTTYIHTNATGPGPFFYRVGVGN